MAGTRGFTAKPIPVGADARTYRPGIKKERQTREEAIRRREIARRFSMTQAERDLEDERNAAFDVSGAQFREECRSLGAEEASSRARLRNGAIEDDHQRKLAALPPDKRSDGSYDVDTFDFEAHQRAQREAFEAKVMAMFPPADSKAGGR